MTIVYVDGDLIQLAKAKRFDVIVHGCNCFNKMGAGIALQIARAFPSAEAADNRTTMGDAKKLGTLSCAEIPEHQLTIVNAYTQFRWGKDLRYDAVQRCMSAISNKFGGQGKKFGLPFIGAGLAGGDWNRIEAIILEELGAEDITVVRFRRE